MNPGDQDHAHTAVNIPPALAAAYREGFDVYASLLQDAMGVPDSATHALTHLSTVPGRFFFAVLAVTDTEGHEYPVMDVGPFPTASAADTWARQQLGKPAWQVAPHAFETYFEADADTHHPVTGLGLTIIGPGNSHVIVNADRPDRLTA